MVDVNWLHAGVVLAIFGLTYIGIVKKEIDKTLSAVIGAALTALALDFLGVISNEIELLHEGDLQIIGLIFGTLMLVDVAQESGVFHFISVKILKLTEGDPKRLMRYFGALTLVLSALVNNISAMMIVGSLTIIAAERLELRAKPYIVVELSMTTVGGIVTLISSVPNIIIASPALFNISFAKFFLIGFPWSVVCMYLNFIIFERLYKDEITEPSDPEEMKKRVNEFDEWSAVADRGFFYKSVGVLTVTIIAFVFSSQLGLSLAIIAIAGGITIVAISGKKLDSVMAKLDWGLIAFFLGLFVLIAGLDKVGFLDWLAVILGGILPNNGFLAAVIILWVIALISGIVDNIVVAAAFGPVLKTVAEASPMIPKDLIAWATIFGANFGGGLTPIGAPSAVVGLAILYRKTGEKMGWGEFFKTQGLATLVRLVATVIYLFLLDLFLLNVLG